MLVPHSGEVRQLVKKFGRVVFEQEFTLPNGEKKDFFLFAGSNKPAIILPFTKEGEVVCINQFRFAAEEVLKELPGGNLNPGQSWEECIKKELIEETGYVPERILKLGDNIWFDPASWRANFAAYLTIGDIVKSPEPEETEIIEVVKVPLRKWLEMVFGGEVRDAKSIAVTLLALPHLGYVF